MSTSLLFLLLDHCKSFLPRINKVNNKNNNNTYIQNRPRLVSENVITKVSYTWTYNFSPDNPFKEKRKAPGVDKLCICISNEQKNWNFSC